MPSPCLESHEMKQKGKASRWACFILLLSFIFFYVYPPLIKIKMRSTWFQ
jgi:hypothetical protein